AGKYMLRGMADDGFRLWLDGNVVLNRWGGAGDESKEVDLTEGLHAMKVEYNEYGATAAVRLIWQLRDLSSECAVPAAALYHDSAGIAAMVESPP
ncbi:MAG TPA: PA14 domain-containing protein, partial [Sphingomicrobium sp.]|nr:PA14 domain-containing protein [Sphingomicrobium sp.]